MVKWQTIVVEITYTTTAAHIVVVESHIVHFLCFCDGIGEGDARF